MSSSLWLLTREGRYLEQNIQLITVLSCDLQRAPIPERSSEAIGRLTANAHLQKNELHEAFQKSPPQKIAEGHDLFRTNLGWLLTENTLSERKLAEFAGVTQSWLNRIKNGHVNLQLFEVLQTVSRVYGFSIDSLLKENITSWGNK